MKDGTLGEAECSRHWKERVNRLVCGNRDLHFHNAYQTSLCFRYVLKGQLFIACRGAIPKSALFDTHADSLHSLNTGG